MARFNFFGSFLGGGETGRGGGRTKLFTKKGMFIISFINVILLSEIFYLYSLHCKWALDVNIQPSVQGRLLIPGKRSNENVNFTKHMLLCLYLANSYFLLMLILLSGDVHPNPGPISNNSN